MRTYPISMNLFMESENKPEPIVKSILNDVSHIISETDTHMKRIGWTTEQRRNHLVKIYGKRSRVFLTSNQLLDFLKYLESQPTAPLLTPDC